MDLAQLRVDECEHLAFRRDSQNESARVSARNQIALRCYGKRDDVRLICTDEQRRFRLRASRPHAIKLATVTCPDSERAVSHHRQRPDVFVARIEIDVSLA